MDAVSVFSAARMLGKLQIQREYFENIIVDASPDLVCPVGYVTRAPEAAGDKSNIVDRSRCVRMLHTNVSHQVSVSIVQDRHLPVPIVSGPM